MACFLGHLSLVRLGLPFDGLIGGEKADVQGRGAQRMVAALLTFSASLRLGKEFKNQQIWDLVLKVGALCGVTQMGSPELILNLIAIKSPINGISLQDNT